VKVWNAATGGETLTLRGHTDFISSVSFSPDGKQIVSGSHDHTVKVWDVTMSETVWNATMSDRSP
jgi:WD40 repeat protein